ncbi:MAG: hypothetical protein ACJ75B_18975 [Flavisolibacter sp.]
MKKILSAFIALTAFFTAQSQILDSTLAHFADQYQPEKAYLHYDKSSYYPGETIWFKAYLMEGILPSVDTKSFYVDWIADDGKVLFHTVSPVVGSVTSGQFDIPAEYNGNFIHVRAYSRWMLNFDTAFLYNQDIRIINKNSTTKTPRPSAIPSLEFFPEGGDAITGISNRIAFKASDQWGRPVHVSGVVIDNKGKTVDTLHELHDGMGSIYITPEEGLSYSAKWKDEKGLEHTTALPKTKSQGVSMQVSISGNKRIVVINASSALPDDLKQLHLVGTMGRRKAFQTDISITPGNGARRIIPTEPFSSGILVLTLFDANWNAVAERISFINNNDYSFPTSMEVEHWGLSSRKRNELKITLPDSLAGASLSISVTDAAIEKDTSDNIISHLMLSSEIRGRINNPAYYFSSNADSVTRNLDLVMLTNGWRRYKWEDLVKGKLPTLTYPKDTSYLTLSGKLFGVQKSQLSGKESIVLFIKEKDSNNKVLILPIDRNGQFNDPDALLFDTVRVYYSLKSKFLSLAEAKFMIDRLPTPNYTSFSKSLLAYRPFSDTSGIYHHSLLAEKANELAAIQRGSVMENITITAKQKPPLQVMDEKYAKGLFAGGDGYQFDLVNDPVSSGYVNVLQYLQGKVAGLQITSGAGTPSLSWRGGAPSLYLDEIPTDADMISSIPVSDVAYVKVFRPPFMGSGGGGGNGAIVIYTRKGSDTKSTSGGLSSNQVVGYSTIKEFYSPNYDRFDPRNEHADIRTTLYWNPYLDTQKHTITVTFYNNDTAKSFRVVIEGMSVDGLLTHHEEIME